MKWKGKLIDYVFEELKKDIEWEKISERILTDSTIGIHLAVFNEPFMALIFKGEKRIESRFSINQISPFMKVSKGDIVILKSSGGPVAGVFLVGEVFFFSSLNKTKLKEIERNYGRQICAHYDPKFWTVREVTKFATLMRIEKLKALTPVKIEKKDRMAWCVLRQGFISVLL